jgi:hypothetical protein
MKKLMLITISVITSLTVAAQNKNKAMPDTTMKAMAKYSCPMHPEVTGDKPGKCSKCGMDLTKSKKEQMKMYTCPMHPEVTSDKPGKCSKCGMDLVKVKGKTKAKRE